MATIDTSNAGEWKARIDRPVCTDKLEVWIYRRTTRGDTEIAQPDGRVWRLLEGTERPSKCRPTFTLNGFAGKQLMLALAEALSEEGIRSPNDHAIRGQLEAQTAHLNDLRMLLKLNKPSGDKAK
jgi:hypothetical protein